MTALTRRRAWTFLAAAATVAMLWFAAPWVIWYVGYAAIYAAIILGIRDLARAVIGRGRARASGS